MDVVIKMDELSDNMKLWMFLLFQNEITDEHRTVSDLTVAMNGADSVLSEVLLATYRAEHFAYIMVLENIVKQMTGRNEGRLTTKIIFGKEGDDSAETTAPTMKGDEKYET